MRNPDRSRIGRVSVRALWTLVLLTSALACSRSKSVSLPKDDEVVARVNGTPITRYDVEYTGRRSLGQLALPSIEQSAYPKLLDAAVQSRAIALEAELELTPLEKQALDKEVAAYREQLLVRRHLEKRSPVKHPTPEMVVQYYEKFPERFGGGKVDTYEIVGSSRAPSPQERDRLLDRFGAARSQSDWKTWAATLEREGLPVTFTIAAAQDRILHGKLRELVASLQPGAVSQVAFVEGRIYVARAAGSSARSPKPFEEVREEIERLLIPAQYSAAIRTAAQDVLKKTKVEIVQKTAATGAQVQRGEQ